MRKYNVTKAAVIRYPYGAQALSPLYWSDRKVAQLRAQFRREVAAEMVLFRIAVATGLGLLALTIYLESLIILG